MVKYEKSFKFEAIALSDIFGVAYTAGWLGIPYCTLKDWRRQYKNTASKHLAVDAPEVKTRKTTRSNRS